MRAKTAFVWDFDGVIARTPHEEAWRLACEKWGVKGFTGEFYALYVSGKPRLEGARNILERLAPSLLRERGEAAVEEFAEDKTRIYLGLVESGRYSVNWSVVKFIEASKQLGVLQVLASASRNVLLIATREYIGGRRLLDLFDADVSGTGRSKVEVFARAVGEALRLSGGSLGCAVFFDDAPAGVRAAKELGGKAVGCFDRRLSEYGADVVVEDFSSVAPGDLLLELGCGV